MVLTQSTSKYVSTINKHICDSSGAEGKTDRDLLLELMDKFTDALSTLNSPPEVNEATVRANKLEKLYGFFIKHTNLKQYKPYDSIDVRLW